MPFPDLLSQAQEFTLPNAGKVRGMGLPQGITLIVGGGFHGKSTLLKALEAGVYNHIPGDGRELVVTDPTAYKARARPSAAPRRAALASDEDAESVTRHASGLAAADPCGGRPLRVRDGHLVLHHQPALRKGARPCRRRRPAACTC